MPENTKREKTDAENKTTKPCAEKKETRDEIDLSREEQNKSYYYDDAHGYEIYNPDEDDED